jgi:hypothetical protein
MATPTHARLLESLLAALAVGCQTGTGNPCTLLVGSGEAGSSFATPAGSDASAAALTVSASANDPVLCPGQCAELTAQASGGKAPYIFTSSPANRV